MKSIQDIFNALDLFYANKHMYDRLKPSVDKREQLKQQSIRKGDNHVSINNL